MTNAPDLPTLFDALDEAVSKEVALASAIHNLEKVLTDLDDPNTWTCDEDAYIGPKAAEVLAHLRLRHAAAQRASIAAGAALDAAS